MRWWHVLTQGATPMPRRLFLGQAGLVLLGAAQQPPPDVSGVVREPLGDDAFALLRRSGAKLIPVRRAWRTGRHRSKLAQPSYTPETRDSRIPEREASQTA